LVDEEWAWVDVGDGQSLLIVMELQHTRDDVVANVKIYKVAVNSANQNRVAICSADGTGNTAFAADVASHRLRFQSNVLYSQVALGRNIAKTLIFKLVRKGDNLFKFPIDAIFHNLFIFAILAV